MYLSGHCAKFFHTKLSLKKTFTLKPETGSSDGGLWCDAAAETPCILSSDIRPAPASAPPVAGRRTKHTSSEQEKKNGLLIFEDIHWREMEACSPFQLPLVVLLVALSCFLVSADRRIGEWSLVPFWWHRIRTVSQPERGRGTISSLSACVECQYCASGAAGRLSWRQQMCTCQMIPLKTQ